MKRFQPIPAAHPLAEAASYANSYAEEQGLEKTLEWAGVGATVNELCYLAQQRALRAVAARAGINLTVGLLSEQIAEQIMLSDTWQCIGLTLIAAYLDGILIGWVGRGLRERE